MFFGNRIKSSQQPETEEVFRYNTRQTYTENIEQYCWVQDKPI